MPLLDLLIEECHRQGKSERALALAAGLSPETLSRQKSTGATKVRDLEKLLAALDVQLVLSADGVPVGGSTRARDKKTFRDKYPTLVWYKSTAEPAVLIRAALVQPKFQMLLDAAVYFGLDAVEKEWAALIAGDDEEAKRAAHITDRLLRNIRLGYEQAQA
ncbi:hypothetical protein FNU76_03500 [Chitinimonas arctica]|uniref:Uncharacterized protein n=1 Tax=Chitinimonas arctica TaxID=2594795 RepID=A0A516SBH0_9NEIS|nr:hypothetical protein [Chitinimonas arctica]QDQ25495.1 hypothetical protein FNU76_03500 [Chitinimonas arctica]